MQSYNENEMPPEVAKETRQAMEAMLRDLKKHLKSYSKNELIRMIGSVMIDNHILKAQLDSLTPKEIPSEAITSDSTITTPNS